MIIEFDNFRQPAAKIKVVGVGGAGGNAVNRMIEARIGGVDFIVANTDSQVLERSAAPTKLQIGAKRTNGLGCGARPEIGREAALEDTERIIELLDGADMVFVTAGMGGGTGTGAAPIIATLAAELGALTVGVVTKPFGFEGRSRMRRAEEGINALKEVVDTLICIPNERLLAATGANRMTLDESFRFADDVLCQAVQGISDIIVQPGLINVDFADVRTIMSGKGMAIMGTGVAEGTNRAIEAAQRAISNPLLEETSIVGAKSVLINITAARADFQLQELNEASNLIEEKAGAEETIIGAVYDESMGERMKITVIATGFNLPAGNVIPINPNGQNTSANGGNVTEARNLDEPTFLRRKTAE